VTDDIAVEGIGLTKRFPRPHRRTELVRQRILHPLHGYAYEKNNAVDDVTLRVRQGEFFGVIGPNGSGKSTLLKLLASIYQPDAGTVSVRGRLSPFIELGVGFSGDLNARDNVRLTGTLMGLTRRELDSKFAEIIAFAELERFVDEKLRNYSSGMALRLAYSLAIQVPFDILLLDEVLAVGDERFQEKCYDTLVRIRQEGKTVIFVSHNLYAVQSVCDRAMLLRSGSTAALGTPADVIALYRAQEGTEDPWPADHPSPEETALVWGTDAASQ
jgi:ABC-type polysaccharide/polyol phosphate transport system ATPase subunit